MKVHPKQVSRNANRLLKALVDHSKERKDIEQLAAALNYVNPAQLETDVEDFITAMIALRKRAKVQRRKPPT